MASEILDFTVLIFLPVNYFHNVICFSFYCVLLRQSLIKTWSSKEETSRVLAFLSVNRLIRMKQESLLEPTLKVGNKSTSSGKIVPNRAIIKL